MPPKEAKQSQRLWDKTGFLSQQVYYDMAIAKNLRVTQTRSQIGRLPAHRACLVGLGLRRVGHSVRVVDNPSVRGMINKVSYMLKVEET